MAHKPKVGFAKYHVQCCATHPDADCMTRILALRGAIGMLERALPHTGGCVIADDTLCPYCEIADAIMELKEELREATDE
jgi:hypothetical protein